MGRSRWPVPIALSLATIILVAVHPAAGATGTETGLLTAPGVRSRVATPGAQLWVSRYNGPANGWDGASSAGVSPDGTKVFVTGISDGGSTKGFDYATVAYDSSGHRLWVRRYNGPGNGWDYANDLAISADGARVFVTGQSPGSTSGYDYATIAYDASTGAELWLKRYNGPGNGDDFAAAMAVSPDGTKVFVTGVSCASGCGTGDENDDYATVAYEASTGAKLWVKRYNGPPGNGYDSARSAAVSPDGSTVFVTGSSARNHSGIPDYATVAYDSSGHQLWVGRYNGPGNGGDAASSVAASPDGTDVFVTGISDGGSPTGNDYATVAYDSSGHQLWVSRYNDPSNGSDQANSIAASPDGAEVFVTGFTCTSDCGFGGGGTDDYATVAYDSSGHQLWVGPYNGPGNGRDSASSVAVSPDGTEVFVTGDSAGSNGPDDYATVAYDYSGDQLWVGRYNGPGNSYDFALFVAVSPDNAEVFVTGESTGSNSSDDYATVAYSIS
jgi:hypothetical protein